MFIVDSQIHVRKEETPDRPWVPGARERIRFNGHREEAFSYQEALELMDAAGVDRALIVPRPRAAGAGAVEALLETQGSVTAVAAFDDDVAPAHPDGSARPRTRTPPDSPLCRGRSSSATRRDGVFGMTPCPGCSWM